MNDKERLINYLNNADVRKAARLDQQGNTVVQQPTRVVQGQQGIQGPRGFQGPPGPPGPAGTLGDLVLECGIDNPDGVILILELGA